MIKLKKTIFLVQFITLFPFVIIGAVALFVNRATRVGYEMADEGLDWLIKW